MNEDPLSVPLITEEFPYQMQIGLGEEPEAVKISIYYDLHLL